jgi:hypothetical protein
MVGVLIRILKETTKQQERCPPYQEANCKPGDKRSILVMPMCSWIHGLNHPELCDSRNCQRYPEAKASPELPKCKHDHNRTQKCHKRSAP